MIELPQPENIRLGEVSLRQVVEQRRSVRSFSRKPITQEELSFLLWCAQGVQEVVQNHSTMRTVPSAGARHAFETILLVNNVEDLQTGLYRFLAVDHKLMDLNMETGIADRITEACLGQQFVKTCGATFIWTAVPYRMIWRYGERGYRYMLLDAGHACQNLYLTAESIGCGVCAVAAFMDDELNNCLNLDGKEQFAIYLAAVGKK
jgi:SagB-type dehydrogenase family enzyme